jgi:superfamily I DNA/RNA helicase
MTRQPTDEQIHILDLAQSGDNLMINALAGTGKTSTLEMIERALPTQPILYLVFNKRNSDEAKGKMLSTTEVSTFNSQGHRTWAKTIGRSLGKPDTRKSNEILRTLINEAPRHLREKMWDAYWDVIQGVAWAKAMGYIPPHHAKAARSMMERNAFHDSLDEEPDDTTADLIDAVLIRSIKAAYEGYIDYNDQIYMPTLFGGTFPRFGRIFVDEYQDLNPINHEMLRRLYVDRIVGVGDPWQNIYAFRGAKRGGMKEAIPIYQMTECDLSTSFRCPEAIVRHAQWRVPHFKWFKPGGSVHQPPEMPAAGIPDGTTIICRNNAPLFKLALQLLAIKRGVSLAGSDIGPKLLAIMRKMGPEDMTSPQAYGAIDAWAEDKLAKGSSQAQDLADCMKVFADYGPTLGAAINYAEYLFKQQGEIRLITGHKSKGLEWDNVIHLDLGLCREEEQDLNLRYVITTRSRNRLTEIASHDIKW